MSFDKITHGTPIIPVPGNPSLAVDITNDVLYIGNPLTGTWVAASPNAGNAVTSLNSEKGAITIAAGTGISVTPSGQSITIAATGGGGAATAVNLPTSTASTVGTIAQNSAAILSTFGTNNTFLGTNSGNFTLDTGTATDNTGIGTGTLSSLSTGVFNVSIGSGALANTIDGAENVAIGPLAMNGSTTGNVNVAIGFFTLGSCTGSQNIGIGSSIGGSLTGSSNVLIGSSNSPNITSGGNNTSIGAGSGAVTTGNFNIEIGNGAVIQDPTASNQLSIGNTIYGINFGVNPSIGINVPAPTNTLDILGGITFSGSLNPLVAITANGAIPANISANYVTTVAVALTIAAPGSDNLNIFITTFDTATPTITFTGGTLNSGSAAVTTASFAAFAGSSLHLVSHTGKWNVLGANAVTFG